MLVQGETGLAAVTGSSETPARVGISICDIAAGMHAYTGVLEALRVRDRTGEGAALEVSLFDAMADWMSVPYLHWVYAGRTLERTGLRHPGIAPYGAYRSSEGDTVMIAVQNEREWIRLCEDVLERPDLAADERYRGNPARIAQREDVDRIVQDGARRFTTAELTDRLFRAGVAFGRVNTVSESAAHPQLRWIDVEIPEGSVRLPADPVQWVGRRDLDADRSARARVPALNEHGEALRKEFGERG